jgi:hypothetical protein
MHKAELSFYHSKIIAAYTAKEMLLPVFGGLSQGECRSYLHLQQTAVDGGHTDGQ